MTIKVKVYAPAFVNHHAMDEFGFMHLPDGATLRDVYALLKIPLIAQPVMICTVNYDHGPVTTR